MCDIFSYLQENIQYLTRVQILELRLILSRNHSDTNKACLLSILLFDPESLTSAEVSEGEAL